jgi:hypothetical protein
MNGMKVAFRSKNEEKGISQNQRRRIFIIFFSYRETNYHGMILFLLVLFLNHHFVFSLDLSSLLSGSGTGSPSSGRGRCRERERCRERKRNKNKHKNK